MKKIIISIATLITAALLYAQTIPPVPSPACGATDRHYDSSVIPIAPVGTGTVYYVDAATGSDSNSGTSEGAPFKTISKAVGFGGPGVTVRIKAGLYREAVYITKSGALGNRFVVGAFGNGPVIIDNSQRPAWVANGSIWQAPAPSGGVVGIVVDGKPTRMELTQAAVTPGGWAKVGSTIYLGDDPATHDVVVVGDYDVTETTTVYLNPSSYLTLYGLTMRGASKNVLNIWGTNVRVERCRILYGGKNGISVFNYSTTASTDAEIVKNEIAWNMMKNWPRGRSPWAVAGGSWGMGAVSNGALRTTFQGNYVHNNGGEGLGAYSTGANGAIFRDNIAGDNWSVNIYVDNTIGTLVENNYLYSHKPNIADAYNSQVPPAGQQGSTILKRLRPECLMTADENYGNGANLSGVTIRNNIMVGCRDGYIHSPDVTGSAMKAITFTGNTVVGPQTVEPTDGTLQVIGLRPTTGNSATFRDNIFFGFNVAGVNLTGPIPAGVTLDHNLWFGGNGAPGSVGDVQLNPLFVDPLDIGNPDTKALVLGSPAIDAGVAITGLDSDYNFCARIKGVAQDLGATEFAAPIIVPSPSPSPSPTPTPVPSPTPTPCPAPTPCPLCPDPPTFTFTVTHTCTWNLAKLAYDCN